MGSAPKPVFGPFPAKFGAYGSAPKFGGSAPNFGGDQLQILVGKTPNLYGVITSQKHGVAVYAFFWLPLWR